MVELFAVVKAGTGEMLWSAVTSIKHAEETALGIAVVQGNVNLLSGQDLAEHLIGAELRRLSPTHALSETWKPGERVELVVRHGENQPGTVQEIRRIYGYHEHLVVAFDDGNTEPVNPDMIRHIREKETA